MERELFVASLYDQSDITLRSQRDKVAINVQGTVELYFSAVQKSDFNNHGARADR